MDSSIRENNGNRIAAWASIVEDENKAKAYKEARGKGGHVRANWRDVTDIIAAQILYTIKKILTELQDSLLYLQCL